MSERKKEATVTAEDGKIVSWTVPLSPSEEPPFELNLAGSMSRHVCRGSSSIIIRLDRTSWPNHVPNLAVSLRGTEMLLEIDGPDAFERASDFLLDLSLAAQDVLEHLHRGLLATGRR